MCQRGRWTAPYRVPSDNPIEADTGARQETRSYGFRIPYRFSFDREAAKLWAGDVNQSTLENIYLVVRDGNYGWTTLKRTQCFSPPTSYERASTITPIWEYSTDDRCSIIGGYVYRGNRLPSLSGGYIYDLLLFQRDLGPTARRPKAKRAPSTYRHRGEDHSVWAGQPVHLVL